MRLTMRRLQRRRLYAICWVLLMLVQQAHHRQSRNDTPTPPTRTALTFGVAAQEDPEKVLAAADAESKIKRSKVSLVKMIRWCTSVVASQQHADSCAAGQGSQR